MTDSPFSKRDYDRFGVEILERYFTVHVLDFTPWLKPQVWKVYSNTGYAFPGCHLISNESDFKGYLLNVENCLAIDYLSAGIQAIRIRKKLLLRGIRRVVTDMGGLPEAPPTTFIEKIERLTHRTNLFRVITSKISYLVSSFFIKEPLPDIALVSGTVLLQGQNTEHANKIWAHSCDYDTYLKLRSAHGDRSRPYAVYVDSDVAHNSDYLTLGWKPCVRADVYYPALFKFFDMFEQATGMEVVFAAHPRSQWDLRLHLLAGRVPVYGKTAELIRDSQLAFSSVSTAISFAVLWQIPLVILTTDEFEASPLKGEISLCSQSLKVPLINLDRVDQAKVDLAAWRVVNQEAYAIHKERFIKKSGTPDLPAWEIFARSVTAGGG